MSTKYCKNCGKAVPEGTFECPHCGASLGMVLGDPIKPTPDNMKAGDVLPRAQIFYALDNGSFGWIALGLLFPVGLLLYFLWRKKYPARAKALLIGAVFAIVLIAISVAVYFLDDMFFPQAELMNLQNLSTMKNGCFS